MNKPCPICGKPCVEQTKWPGLWVCEDHVTPLNSAPPYRYKCQGMVVDREAVRTFFAEIDRLARLN